jgi:hypothetical protein
VEKAAPAGMTPAPSKATTKKTEPIQSTKGFAEHSGLARTSAVVGTSVKDASDKDAGKIEDLLMDSRGQIVYAAREVAKAGDGNEQVKEGFLWLGSLAA